MKITDIVFTPDKDFFKTIKTKAKSSKPLSYFMINSKGEINTAPFSGKKSPERITFGNCFKTEKQAILAKKRTMQVFRRVIKIKK